MRSQMGGVKRRKGHRRWAERHSLGLLPWLLGMRCILAGCVASKSMHSAKEASPMEYLVAMRSRLKLRGACKGGRGR